MPSAPDAPALLQRVLVLERQQGFQDRAAVGGISAFARLQIERSGPAGVEGLAEAADCLRGYEAADRGAREAAVAAALNMLLRRGHVAVSTPAAPSARLPDQRVERTEIPTDVAARANPSNRLRRRLHGHVPSWRSCTVPTISIRRSYRSKA